MKRLAQTASLLAAFCAFDTQATPAVVTVYYDRASFESAIGPHVTYTFDVADGFPVAPADISFVGPARMHASDVSSPARLRPWPEGSGNQTLSGTWNSVTTGLLLVRFDQPQFAFGLDMYVDGIEGLLSVGLADGSGQSVGAPNYEIDLLIPTFVGVVSEVSISGFNVSSIGDFRSQRYKGIDNLTIIPEPGGFSLGMIGLSIFLNSMCRRLQRICVKGSWLTRREGCAAKRPMGFSPSRQRPACLPVESRRLLSVTWQFDDQIELRPSDNVNATYVSATDIHADSNQSEQAAAIDPTNPSRMFVFANDSRKQPGGSSSDPGMYGAYSDDAGATWHFMDMDDDGIIGTDAADDPLYPYPATVDPSVTFDQFGNLYIAYVRRYEENLVRKQTIVLALSTNGGRSISGIWEITDGTVLADQPTVICGPSSDPILAGTTFGSVWVTYATAATQADAENGHWFARIRGAVTNADGLVDRYGTTIVDTADFSTEFYVRPNTPYQNFGDVAVGPDGEVIVAFQDPTTRGDSDDNVIFTCAYPDGLATDSTFVPTPVPVTATNVASYDEIPAHPTTMIDSGVGLAWDHRTGRIYLVYLDEPSNESHNTNVYVRYSADLGLSWSTDPVLVSWASSPSQPAAGSQFMPRIALDADTGYVGVAWYDCRDDANNLATRFYASVGIFDETLEELSFLANVQVSDGTSSQRDGDTFDYGDYTGLAFVGGSLYPCWADNSNSTGDNDNNGPGGSRYYDLYTARVIVESATRGQSITVTGTSSADHVTVALDPSGTYVQIWQSATPAGRPDFTATLAAISKIQIDGLSGADHLSLLTAATTGAPLDLRLTGGAHAFATDDPAAWAGVRLTASNASSVTFDADQHLASLTLEDSATATIANDANPAVSRLLAIDELTLGTGTWLDLRRNALLVGTPAAPADLTTLSADFSNQRIRSTDVTLNATARALDPTISPATLLAAKGYLDLRSAALPNSLGIEVAAEQVLFRYTILGDTNNDGLVDLADLNNILNRFGASVSFAEADTNNDGTITLEDLNNVLNNFGFTIFDTIP